MNLKEEDCHMPALGHAVYQWYNIGEKDFFDCAKELLERKDVKINDSIGMQHSLSF